MKTFCIHLLLTLCAIVSSFSQESPSLDQLISPTDQQKMGIAKLTATEREHFRQLLLTKMIESYKLGAAKAQQAATAVPKAVAPQGVLPRSGLYAGTGAGHWVKENIDRGKMFLLEDGSLWEVDRFEKLDAMLWLKMSNITVVESNDGMPGYNYLLINTDDGEKVHAKYIGRK
jgi:hypothetical protein